MFATIASLGMQAQSNIIKTKAANAPDGKILTMEDTFMSRDLILKNLNCKWLDNEHIAIFKDSKWHKYDINTEECVRFRPGKPKPFAYTKGRSIYLLEKDSTSTPIAVSEDKNITYGQFVSRNEFGISKGIFVSPDSSKVAFYRKDESLVGTFPLLDVTTRTGTSNEIRYPMAGMQSERVSLGIYDVKTAAPYM